MLIKIKSSQSESKRNYTRYSLVIQNANRYLITPYLNCVKLKYYSEIIAVM